MSNEQPGPRAPRGRAPSLSSLFLRLIPFALMTGCGSPPDADEAALPAPMVSIAKAVQQPVPIILAVNGTVEAIRAVDIVPRVSGYLEERYFEEGTDVAKDAPLYRIDPRPFQAALDTALSELKNTEAQLEYQELEAKRRARLAKQGAASQEDLEESLSKQKQLQATIEKQQATIELARLNLDYTEIKAPFAGRIQRTRFNVGSLVRAQQDVLTTLVQADPIYVSFHVSRNELFEAQRLQSEGLVETGMLATRKIRVKVLLPDGSEHRDEGALDYVGTRVDPTTGTLRGRAIVPNPHDKIHEVNLLPGQYAPVRLILGERDAVVIPEQALIEGQAGTHVYVVDADQRVALRQVEPGRVYRGQQLINAGLQPGEHVVIDGSQHIQAGMTVQLRAADTDADAATLTPE